MSFIKLFDLVNKKVVPSEHCYTLNTLKKIMEVYPEESKHVKVYAYLFYMTCPVRDFNPFFNLPEDEKKEIILKEVQIDFSLDQKEVEDALLFCVKLYETTTVRAFLGFKNAIDKLSTFLNTVQYTTGRDGSITAILSAMKNFADIRESFQRVNDDLEKEQQGVVRGKQRLAYDSK